MEKKLRRSRQRDAIYQYLAATDTHPSAEMIYSQLRFQIPDLSLGTVYRNLKLPETLGMVRRVASHSGRERYDACHGDHAHFLCRSCGSIRDLILTAPLRSSLHLDEGCRIEQLSLTVTGLCPNCTKCSPERRVKF